MRYIIVGILLFAIFIGIFFFASNKFAEGQGLYQKPGHCPKCGTKLEKGIYGYYTPKVIWYCPEC